MILYTLSEFRANIRQAFERVQKGEVVLIDRYDETYELRAVSEAAAQKIIADSQQGTKGNDSENI